MFLKHKQTGVLIEVLGLEELSDPSNDKIKGRSHAGEELQGPEAFPKSALIFPSGEALPVCWLDAQYKEHQAS
ncbi:MAG: acetyltransferase [Geitlerinemataceae cyanobacterium]